MFEHLKEHHTILVTGLHRCRSTIAARMIAEDTGHMFIPEEGFRFGNIKIFETLIYRDDCPKVIQCPFMLKRIQWYKDCLVVFVHRPKHEIIASLDRMKREDGKHLDATVFMGREGADYHISGDVIDAKLKDWEWQRTQIPKLLEINSEDLNSHPLWIEDRDWHYRATEYAVA